jgi:hypothetical protein
MKSMLDKMEATFTQGDVGGCAFLALRLFDFCFFAGGAFDSSIFLEPLVPFPLS